MSFEQGRALAERGLLATFRILGRTIKSWKIILCKIREFYKRVK